ncbi:beta-lactamase family protein [Pseudomonadales bacterium]|nr:beta-lactamase family protein [Pseudomonadales bacterium]MDC1368171.1 beta-lactamase family protein [Pseudomonadales bacterium]
MCSFPATRESQVTFANYARAPFNTWSFWNMDSVAHTAMLPRGGELPKLMSSTDASLGQRIIKDANGHELTLDELLEEHDADGFLVLRDNQILYENYFNGFSEHSRHIWFSMTKSLVSVALGVLMESFDIDLTSSPGRYIEELRGSGFDRASIQDVLNHASAIAFKENYVDPDSEFLRYYAPALGLAFVPGAQDAQPANANIYGIYDFLEKFIQADSAQQPGDLFEYNSANADVIGWLIARLSGMPLQEFIGKHIWSRLGTYHDAAIVVDRAYMPVATGGMTSTLRDAALFGQLILNRGQANGEQLVPQKWINEILNLNAADQQRYAKNTLYGNEPWQYYKNMWWILDPAKQEYAAVGIHGQVIYINGSTNTVVAQFSSQPSASQVGSMEFRSKLMAIRAIAG